MKASVRQDPNYGNVLFKDGTESFCPFQPPIQTQSKSALGDVVYGLMRPPCCTKCPMANITDDKYFVNCGGEIVSYDIVPEEVKQEGKLHILGEKK